VDITPLSQSSEFLSLASVSDADICKATKSVGLDGIPQFILHGCSVIFILLLRHIFNLRLTQQYFPAGWKEATIVPLFKRGNHAAVSNRRPIFILNNFSGLFRFIIHDHVLHYIKLNPNQHGFTKSESTVTNLVTFLDCMTPVVRGQRQADAVYFDLPYAFELSSFGFSDSYVGWFRSYLTNGQSRVHVSDTLSLPFHVTSGVPQDSVLGPFQSIH
jgi:hypothetical protein